MSLKLFLLLATVTVALLAAGNSPNHHEPIFRSGELPGERVRSLPGTSFQTLSSNCGRDNSGNIAIGPKTANSNYVAGSSSPFVNLQAAQAEVISNGYRVTWFVESIPNVVQVCGDYVGSGSWSYDLELEALIYDDQNCIFSGSSMISMFLGHRYTYGVSCTLQNKTFEQALKDDFDVNYVKAKTNGGYSTSSIPSTKNLTINPSDNSIIFEVYAPALSVPDPTEAAGYSVYFTAKHSSLYYVDTDICKIEGTKTPKTCLYPAPFGPSSSSAPVSSSSKASASGGGIC